MTTLFLKELAKNGYIPDDFFRLPEIDPIENELKTFSALFQILVQGGVDSKNATDFICQLVERKHSDKHAPNAPLNIHHVHGLFTLDNTDISRWYPGSSFYIKKIDKALLQYAKTKAPQLFKPKTK